MRGVTPCFTFDSKCALLASRPPTAVPVRDHGLLTPVLSAHKLDSRLRRVPDVSVDRFFFLVLHEWVTMIAKERVAAFLLAHQPRSFCDECLARALEIDPSTGHRAAVKAGP